MRVIAGSARGATLQCPKGRAVRPTSDRVRESLFSILAERVAGNTTADLFAGAGTLGIEALSRGAAHVVFVEKDRQCARLIETNLAHTRLTHLADVVRCDVFRCLARLRRSGRTFGLVLCDPPYTLTGNPEGLDRLEKCLAALADEGLVAADALLVLEHAARSRLPEAMGGWRMADGRRYGDTALSFFQLAASRD